MAKDNKFGTFGGVYTPSVLTILGVIMYLRLPWIIGHAGLYAGLGIILVAHLVSFSTGLSISSIATDKNVGAGGPYYIVSRSLGLPIGGTLGLALFVGLSFSISLYVIGFSESILRTLEIEASPMNIRLSGTIVLVLLTVITVVSTALAIKAQYIIFALIAVSLLSICWAPGQAPATPALAPADGGEPLAKLFAIFFPAVTGFTAGVNMSGDLRNPKKAIPKGTLLAITTGLLVYVGLAVFLSFRVPRELLLNDPAALSTIALYESPVSLGIWGATLSSALGSLLGAPRILQAVSADGITPAWFAKGYGKTQEPRNALLLAFLIGWAGIMIAELDAIARIVSMVFLVTYGFLNLSCAIESWASPDFRPEFRIPKSISVLGAAICVLVMILLDLPAMFGSVAIMAGLYAWLARRQLQLESGDTWEGFWASLVRKGLHKLNAQQRQHRNWRPNVLLFRRSTDTGGPLLGFAHSLVSGNGLLTDFRLRPLGVEKVTRPSLTPRGARSSSKAAQQTSDEAPVGVFSRVLPTDSPPKAILDAARYHGFAGLSPNTVLLDWPDFEQKHELLANLVEDLTQLDYNLLLYAGESEQAESEKQRCIDIWWSPRAGNLAFNLALIRFITSSEHYEDAKLRFFLISNDASNNDVLRTRTRRILAEARVTGSIEVINNALEGRLLSDWIQEKSVDASLVLLGLANEMDLNTAQHFSRLEELRQKLRSVLVVRGSSQFSEILSVARAASDSLLPSAEGPEGPKLAQLDVEGSAEVKTNVAELATSYEAIVAAFQEHCIARAYSSRVELLRHLRELFERQFTQLRKGTSSTNRRKQRKLFNRVQSTLLMDAKKAIERFAEHSLPEQRATLDGRIEAFLQDERLLPSPPDELREFFGTSEQFSPLKADSQAVRRYKWRRRAIAWVWRAQPSYFVPLRRLEAYYREQLIRQVLAPATDRVASDSHQLAVHLGKALNSAEVSLNLLRGLEKATDVEHFLHEQEAQMLEHFDSLIEHEKERAKRQEKENFSRTHACLQAYASDVARVDIKRVVNKLRPPSKETAAAISKLDGAAENWFKNQRLLFKRAAVALQISEFQHRLSAIVEREREQFELELRSGLLKTLSSFLARLEALHDELASEGGTMVSLRTSHGQLGFEYKANLDPTPLLERLEKESLGCAQDLPESIETPTNEALEALEEKGTDEVEVFQLSVKPLILFLVESELTGILRELLSTWPTQERRTAAVGQDVARLLAFQFGELEAIAESSPEELQAQLAPAVHNGIERIRAELERVERDIERGVAAFEEQLRLVLNSTSVSELAGAADSLDQKVRLERGRRAVTGFRGGLARLQERLKTVSIRALYQISTGVLQAQKLTRRPSPMGSLEAIRRFVTDNSPKPDVLDKLPFFYRQLFFGQSTLNETFWVERKLEVAHAKRVLRDFKRGAKGCLVIKGERGSGKSALWQHVAARHLDRHSIHRLHPVAGGSTDPSQFRAALEEAIGRKGAITDLMLALPPRSVIVLDDFELWWQRSPSGFAIVDLVLSLIDRYGDQCLFVLCMNRQAYDLIAQVRPFGDRALGIVECGPMGAEALKNVIQLRHSSTGTKFSFENRDEETLSQWRVAKLFAAHFHYCRGLVGPALQAWVSHVSRAEERIIISRPSPAQMDDLDGLRVEHTALLVQLALHKQMHESRLAPLGAGVSGTLLEHLTALERMGLVTAVRPHIYEINRFAHHLVVERFQRLGLLS